MTKPIFLLSAMLIFLLNVAHAQDMEGEEIDDSGFFIGVSLMGTSFEIPELSDERDTGGGIALEAGYNFNTNFAVFLSLDGSSMSPDEGDNYSLAHFDLGVEGRLGDYDSSFRPFAKASVLGAAATFEDEEGEFDMSGTGFGLGVGFYYFINKNFAIDLGYTYSWININEISVGSVSIEVEENGSSGRLGLGFSYHF